MIEVDKQTFYTAVGGPENIHPRSETDHSAWMVVNTGELVGKSEPGYKSPFGTPSRYWLSDRFHALKVKGEGMREPVIVYQDTEWRIVADGAWSYSVQHLIKGNWIHLYGCMFADLKQEIENLKGSN